MTTLLKKAVAKVQALPEHEQDRLASLLLSEIGSAAETRDAGAGSRPIWDEVAAIGAEVPEEVWDRLPRDGAAEHDHYLYGTPKRTA